MESYWLLLLALLESAVFFKISTVASCLLFVRNDQYLRNNYTSLLSTTHVSKSKQQSLQYILENDEEINCFDFSIDWSTALKILEPSPLVMLSLLLLMVPRLLVMFESCVHNFVRATIKASGRVIAVLPSITLVPVIGPGLIRFLTAVRVKLLTTVWHPYFGAFSLGREFYERYNAYYVSVIGHKTANWYACSMRQDRVEKMRSRFGQRMDMFSEDEQAVIRNISGLDIDFDCFTPDPMTVLFEIVLAASLIISYNFIYKRFMVPLREAYGLINEDEDVDEVVVALLAIGPDGETGAAAG